MTLGELKYHVMFQTNNDADDIGDYTPHLIDYINEAYDRLVKVWAKVHTQFANVEYPRLGEDTDTVGAVTGGLAALYYGYDAIPAEWIDAIRKKEWIGELCGKAEAIVK